MTPPWPRRVPAFAGPLERRRALAGKVALITGASRGLGAGMAAHFAAAGMELILCARTLPPVLASPLPHPPVPSAPDPPGGSGAQADGSTREPLRVALDVRDGDAVEQLAAQAVQRFGRIDLWVNNAGVLEPIGPLVGADRRAVADLVEVNLLGVAWGTAAFARHVRARGGGGVLVNMSSGSATTPYAGWAPYCASKAAVDRLTEVVALEEAGFGLRAYAVAPGIVDTAMQAQIRASSEADFPDVERFHQIKQDEAFSSPEWVAERILELAFASPSGDPRPSDPVCVRVPAEPR